MLKCLEKVAPARTMANAKRTLVDARGEQILPAYYGDRYLSWMPGELPEPAP